MSQPHPRPKDREPGSTPAPGARPNVELERQRAEGDMPGQPTGDIWSDEEPADLERDEGEDEGERNEVPPSSSVPDEAARDAAQSVDPAARSRRPGARDTAPEDPLRPEPSSPNAKGVPRDEQ